MLHEKEVSFIVTHKSIFIMLPWQNHLLLSIMAYDYVILFNKCLDVLKVKLFLSCSWSLYRKYWFMGMGRISCDNFGSYVGLRMDDNLVYIWPFWYIFSNISGLDHVVNFSSWNFDECFMDSSWENYLFIVSCKL